MATFEEIKTVRLSISDPIDAINFLEVETKDDLPTAPIPQTIYKAVDTGIYWYTEIEENAAPENYLVSELQVNDTRIGSWIDTYGVNKAIRRALNQIIARLGAKIQMVRNSTGSESIEFTGLLESYKFYKSILQDYKDDDDAENGNNSGLFGSVHFHRHRVAGGNI